MSVIQDMLKPGGGIALIPFIRMTILTLLLMVIVMGILDVARIHMVVLAFLSIGLLMSISHFEKVWNDVQRSRGGVTQNALGERADKEQEKTD
mmetsp:Transcript_29012/g.61576  ORF Transcript_29012/g.61576 Transcript_29012/m.61576 type:complete len:93 (-) Transcript_29012:248-526(-)|eukprot:CAMPEP_0172550486 /NCGR_PEP_ID=MMETSP1067-20121228/30000_1 /TAXON_ID=265564 ORGANISM="Thalassiosira punctigera, Strain Tpunct2005C2" /NCGR_SAMPLE_ID=MMETSP1067 /ASSEMBLY_ACC=CAM_ASM_000444 /LENGTH=92 /DNA_ID=CAMNT_0013338079 /DNA_START=154 /DNA_END=432 /DNA_ORIENTATION=+